MCWNKKKVVFAPTTVKREKKPSSRVAPLVGMAHSDFSLNAD